MNTLLFAPRALWVVLVEIAPAGYAVLGFVIAAFVAIVLIGETAIEKRSGR